MANAPSNVVPSPEWFQLKGRLFHFLGSQPKWERWTDAGGAWMCGRSGWRDREPAKNTRIAAVLADPQLIPSRSKPEQHDFAEVTARGWNRLLLGVFTYLDGPALVDDVATIAGVMLRTPGAEGLPTGVAYPLGPGDGSSGDAAKHLTYSQMAEVMAGSSQETSTITAHTASCEFCNQQWVSYQQGAPLVSAEIKKPKKVEADLSPAPRHPGTVEPGIGGQIDSILDSPGLMMMIAAGVLLAIGGPYLMWRTFAPNEGNLYTQEEQIPDVPLDLTPLDELEEPYYSIALQILEAAAPLPIEPDPLFGEEPPPDTLGLFVPEPLYTLRAPVGFGLVYPVTEAVESTRPALSWQPVTPPPYAMAIRDSRNQVVASAAALPDRQWIPPVDLNPGEVYRWAVTFGDRTVEDASFVILTREQRQQWETLRTRHQQSPLVLGLVAYQMGLLTSAEQYFEQLVEANPNSEQAVRLLENTIALRE